MIHVNLAPPTLGAWSVAGLLGQPLEYYYYYYIVGFGPGNDKFSFMTVHL